MTKSSRLSAEALDDLAENFCHRGFRGDIRMTIGGFKTATVQLRCECFAFAVEDVEQGDFGAFFSE